MQWREIKGFEGYYEVSDAGMVRSVDRIVYDKNFQKRRLKGRTMKLCESKSTHRNGDGYYVVNLRKDGLANVYPVHRLVAEAFIPNINNYPTVNHKNGDKHNNNVYNLEWASYAENNIHALRLELRKPRGGYIVQTSINGETINVFESVCAASRITGVGRSIISHCVNHRVKTAGGYKWRKIEKCNDYLVNESTTDDEFPLEVQEQDIPEDIVCTNRNI